MLLILFSIYDKCSGIYSEPFTAVNEEVAKRRFKQICVNSPTIAPDLQLYKIGLYFSDVGEIVPNEKVKPEFVEGGVANNG